MANLEGLMIKEKISLLNQRIHALMVEQADKLKE
jgi:hypothetical protein